MKKINLKSSESIATPRRKGSGLSFVLGAIVLLLGFGSYGGVLFVKGEKEKEIEQVQDNVESIRGELDKKEYSELYNFQSRLTEIDELLRKKIILNKVLDKVAAYTMVENVLMDLKFVTKESSVGEADLKIVLESPNLDVISRQIEAYTQMTEVVQVSLGSSHEIDDGGGYEVTLSVKMNGLSGIDSTNIETVDDEASI